MNEAAKGECVSGKLLICVSDARVLSIQAVAVIQYEIETVRKEAVCSKQIGEVEVTKDDCVLRQGYGI